MEPAEEGHNLQDADSIRVQEQLASSLPASSKRAVVGPQSPSVGSWLISRSTFARAGYLQAPLAEDWEQKGTSCLEAASGAVVAENSLEEDGIDDGSDGGATTEHVGRTSQACMESESVGKVTLMDGHIGIAGSLEMPTVLAFEGLEERLFVWRYRRAWCVKGAKPRDSADAAIAPPILGGAKKPPAVVKPDEFKPPCVHEWRTLATLHSSSCLKARAPRSRADVPACGKPSKPTFVEKTVELGRTMQEPQGGWKPAGVASAWGEGGPAWGSWSPPWGHQPIARSRSLPTLRDGSVGKARSKLAKVAANADSRPPEKEMRFVARAMTQVTTRPEDSVNLEATIAERRRLAEWKPSVAKSQLPTAIGDLIGYGDTLFEPSQDRSTMSGPTSTMSRCTDSRSALRDSSQETRATSTSLPRILPKATVVNSTSQESPKDAAKTLTRMAAQREAARTLARTATHMQKAFSPVKASIAHILL